MDIKICSICNKNSDETIINKYTSKKDNKINSRTYNVYININDILNKLQECNMICCLSNVKMTYQKNNWNVISVDRIDSSKNYSIDNIQIICWILNCAKREYKNDDIKQIVNHIKQF